MYQINGSFSCYIFEREVAVRGHLGFPVEVRVSHGGWETTIPERQAQNGGLL